MPRPFLEKTHAKQDYSGILPPAIARAVETAIPPWQTTSSTTEIDGANSSTGTPLSLQRARSHGGEERVHLCEEHTHLGERAAYTPISGRYTCPGG